METKPLLLTQPTYDTASGLWFYGNLGLLKTNLAKVSDVDRVGSSDNLHSADARLIETSAESLALSAHTLVVGIHNRAHQIAAVVPLRWGCPRILVLSGGFRSHLGDDLTDEPFMAARLWRYKFDPVTDLCISRRPPEALPSWGKSNPTVDRLIDRVIDDAAKIAANFDPEGVCRV